MKKVVFIILSILILIISIVIIFFIIKNNKEKNSLSYQEEISIKIGDEIPNIESYVASTDLYKIDGVNIVWKDVELLDNKIYQAGIYDGEFMFNDKKINIKLNVVDDEPPIIEDVLDITIYENESVDLLKNIKTSDNSSDVVDITVEGTYDISKSGEYALKYVAIDKSNNKTEANFKLIVKEKPVVSNNSENRIVGTSTKGYTIEQRNGIYYVNGILIANKTYKLPSTYNPGGLLQVFTSNFNNMKNEAANSGVNLTVVSGFRSYNSQYTIYNNYVKNDGVAGADRYSARAGHSEHQTGLAADINNISQNFINTTEGKWLNDNCYKYGFIIRYPSGKESITGYMYEPWHIRYVGVEVATALYNNGDWISLEEYLGITSQY